MASRQWPWAPFEPTASDAWDLGKVAHLHRRAGFGSTRAELQRDLRAGPAASVERLLRPPPRPTEEQALREGALERRDAELLKAWWLYRIVFGPDPLREKMTLFWHGHFATSNRKVQSVPLMLRQNELLRRHALGSLGDLLAGVLADGAMLVWLDGVGSKKEKPNENLAREFLELFTLGVGHYTEKDVREAARALAGWVRRGEQDGGQFSQDPALADAGTKTFLGRTGAWKQDDVVRITLEQPACAEFLCRKLYRFFVSDETDPPAELIRPLAGELRAHGYSIAHVVGVILRSRHFYTQAAHRRRVQGPVEFGAGLIRALEVPAADVRLLALAAACERQGQDLFNPPSVKGWDGGRTWINSTTVLERGNWANDLVWGNAEYGMPAYDPAAWARRYGLAPGKAAEAFLQLLLQDDLDPEARELALPAGHGGTTDGLRKAVQLILHCPEYQLA
jgi:uncharacterized protein (DUF1800 family)